MRLLDEYLSRKYRTEIRPSRESYLIRDKVAIVGIGATEFSKASGRSEVQLACEAIKAAVEDAGLTLDDIDGLQKFTVERAEMPSLVSNLGIRNLKYYGETPYGGGACCGTVLQAATAIATGVARYVVCYRALNEASGTRFGRAPSPDELTNKTACVQYGYLSPFGMMVPPAWVGMFARRYMHEYGVTSEQFGWVSVVCKDNASRNPKAQFYQKPITIQDHQQSRMIVEPLHLHDCCLDTDGSVAFVLTSAERAKDCKQKPAYLLGATQGLATDGENMTSFYRPTISGIPETWYMGQELFRVAGVTPKDIDVAEFYDAFTPIVPMQMEELGFCGRGEGGAFCDGGKRISLGGELPINTHGGALGEAYIHGMNNIAEAVRQLRGTAVNQVKDAEIALSTGGVGVPNSGVILRR